MSSSSKYQAYIAARCKVNATTGCWDWQLGKTKTGYGAVRKNPHKLATAHRMAYYAFIGELVPGMCICHTCDNRLCVNPAHLVQATPKWNMLDKVAKGRVNATPNMPKGTAHHSAKLSDADIKAIRASSKTQVQLAKEYRVTQSAISRIKSNSIWRHV